MDMITNPAVMGGILIGLFMVGMGFVIYFAVRKKF